MDAISRKQGMKKENVLAQVTDWNHASDDESTPFRYPIPLAITYH
jgi:hypothetical protein